jgi:hypothetical protein
MKENFVKGLGIVAELCQFELKQEIISLYCHHIGKIGFDRGAKALHEVVKSCRPGRPFPSIDDILKAAGADDESDESRAIEAANRIVGAVSRYGDSRHRIVEDYLGPLAWEIVQKAGGWSAVCETMTNANITTMRAQFRESALALCHRARRGLVNDAPSLPPTSESQTNNEIKKLAEGFAMAKRKGASTF